MAEIITEEVHSHELSMIALSIICILNISTYYFRHDMKNHMQLIHTWLENGEYGKAMEYVGKLGKKHGIAQEYVKTKILKLTVY